MVSQKAKSDAASPRHKSSDVSTMPVRIAGVIRDRITGGSLGPGERLASERELADQFGVGRAVVREALGQLRVQGYVISRRGRGGTIVASLADTGVGTPFARLLDGGVGQIIDLYELRLGLEVHAAALAAARRTPEDLIAVQDILVGMRDARDKVELETLDATFHGAVSSAAHNVFYMHINAELMRLFPAHIPTVYEILYANASRSNELYAQHESIYRAIRVRDETEARRAMSDHLSWVMREVLRDETSFGVLSDQSREQWTGHESTTFESTEEMPSSPVSVVQSYAGRD